MTFICTVCHQPYTDTWEHITGKSSGLFVVADRIHNAYYTQLQKTYFKEKCFCGGAISYINAGPAGYIKICLDCNITYDEA